MTQEVQESVIEIPNQAQGESGKTSKWKSTVAWMVFIFLLVGFGYIITFLIWYPELVFSPGPPSIACEFQPPNVDQAAMHHELRQLLLSQYFLGDVGAILVNGGFVTYRYDTDVEQSFRQESNFLYLTGYDQPNATVVIDIVSKKTILFVEDHPESYAIWNGEEESPAQIAEEYGMDDVYFHANLSNVLSELSGGDPNYTIYVMDSIVQFPSKEDYTINSNYLKNAVYSRREVKTDAELDLMRYTAYVSSGAHNELMRFCEPGLYEYNIEGRYLDGVFACGLTYQAYLPICASGNNSAILHYIANDRLMLNGDFLLVDAGAEYFGYAADITRTYPVNGTFTYDQEEVYNMVLAVQLEVISIVYPGLSWSNLQFAAENATCNQLISKGYLAASVDDCLNKHLYYYFFPHGVSHYLGLDVHDRSGIGSGSLEERNVITVEPGIYFNAALLEPVMKDPQLGRYFVYNKIQPLLDIEFGGVRIEDVVIVWNSGPEVVSNSPKTVTEIENLMNRE